MGEDTPVKEGGERAHFIHALRSADQTGEITAPARDSGDVPRRLDEHDLVPAARQTPRVGPRRHLASLLSAVRKAIVTAAIAEWEHGALFLTVPVLIGIGAVIYFSLPVEPDVSAIVGGIAALSFAAWLARHRLSARLLVLACLLPVAGLLAGKAETIRAGTQMLGSAVSTTLTGRVRTIEHQASGRVRMVIDVVGTERPNLRYQPDRIRVSARRIPAGLYPGDGIEGRVQLLPPSGPVRPGSYDFSFRSYFDGFGATGFFLGNPRPVAIPPANGLIDRARFVLERQRESLTRHIRARTGGPNGEIAAALITGKKAGIPEEINEALRITGLAHILSISGLHMALVAGTVIGLFRAGFALAPGFSSRHPVRKYAACAALMAVFFYLFISGASIATRRSFIMLAVMLVALLFDRSAITMRNLAIAAIIVVIITPHEIVSPGFQMSFAATAALIAAYGAWSRRRMLRSELLKASGPVATFLRYAAGLAFTSLIAGTATALFGAFHFQRVAPMGLVANLAAMPVVTLIVMPSAIGAHVLMPFDLDAPAFWAMGHGIQMVSDIAAFFAALSPFDATGAIPQASLIFAAMGLTILTLATTWLRALCLPFFVAAVVFLAGRDAPDVLISEDARLVAVTGEGGALAVNRTRPNKFTLQNWQRAVGATIATPPQKAGAKTKSKSDAGAGPVFICADGLCEAVLADGSVIAHAEDGEAATIACSSADLIVVADATVSDPCGSAAGGPAVITARNLAQRGSAEVLFQKDMTEAPAAGTIGQPLKAVPVIRFSVEDIYRPWHTQRAFSRSARGLAPWKPKRKKPATKTETNRPAKTTK